MISRVVWRSIRGRCEVAIWLLALAVGTSYGRAQIVLDGKFGTSGALAGPSYNITAGMGAIRGNNLFQSFMQFNLQAGETATFSGPANIQNILSRVTGGSSSSIDGTVRSSIAGANLFLINPNGVMFGPHAVVDVSGSFAVSTANYLKLASGARFVASLDADDSVLTTGPVVAFGFLNGANGSIQVQGTLTAGAGKQLSIIGSAVSVADGGHFGARLEAPNGDINLTGVSAAGEVAIPQSRPVAGTSSGTSGSGLNGSGAPSAVSGDVVIRGGQLVVDNAAISTTSGGNIDISLTKGLQVINGAQVTTTSSDVSKGGNIVIDAPTLTINGMDGAAPTRIAAETYSNNPQSLGGNIMVHADSVGLFRGAEISVSSFGAANAGRVDIAANSLVLKGSPTGQNPTQIDANAAPVIGATAGAGGEIVVHAQSVEVDNGAGILAATTGDANAGLIDIHALSIKLANGAISTYTAGAGQGGEIRIQSDSVTVQGPFASITALTTGLNAQSPAGNGGVVNIQAGSLRLSDDAGISASTLGDGKGGDINIAAGSVVLDAAPIQPGSFPGITAATKPSFFGGGTGKGGDITITTGSLSLDNGMPISTTTSTPADGGNIFIQAGTMSLDNSSIQSASTGSGRAGTLTLLSSGPILLNDNSSISTSAPQSSGGNILAEAGGPIRLVNSSITAQAGPGGGGNIILQSPSLSYPLNSTITAQAVGNGGNLQIDPSFLVLNQGRLISKSSTKNGGNITILSDYFFQSSSVIDASAPFGLPGTVQVTAPNVDLSGILIGLPSNLLDVEAQLRPDCGVRLSGNVSSFIVVGQGGLPIEPGGFVPSAALQAPDEQH